MDLQSFKENLRSMKKSSLVKVCRISSFRVSFFYLSILLKLSPFHKKIHLQAAQARIKDFNDTTKNMIDRALNAENIAELKKITNPELNDIVQVIFYNQ